MSMPDKSPSPKPPTPPPPTPKPPVQNPASQPHGTTQDQVNEMESEGQATKQAEPQPITARHRGHPDAWSEGRKAKQDVTQARAQA